MNLLKRSLIAPTLAILLYSNLHANESFTLEEMSLKEAIKTISKKANIPYMVDSKLLKDKKSQKIENIQGLKNALNKILQSSGLEASIIDGTIIIKKKSIPQSSNSLGNVEIISTNTTEDTDSYTIDSMNTATKLNLSIKDTPQSVVVITNQKIEDNNWESIDDIVSNIAGIQPSKYDTDRTYIMARGFEIDYYQIDGMPTSYTGYQQQDLSIYDRVEIVKGANGLMTGAGNPAAAINLVRKHANSKKLTGDITLKAGSWDRYKGSIDITTPLNEAKTVRARIVASYADEESYKDYYSKETSVLYGVIDADISDNTRLSLGASYQENRPEGTTWGGVPAYFSDGSSTSFHPEDSFTPDWTYGKTKTKSAFASFEHYFNNDIKINANYTHMEYDAHLKMALMTGYSHFPDSTTGIDPTSDFLSNSFTQTDTDVLDIYTSIPFELANKNHEIIAGIMYHKKNEDNFSKSALSSIDTSSNSVFSWDSDVKEPSWNKKSRTGEKTTKQESAYIVGRFSLSDDLKLIAGSRLTTYKYNNKLSNYDYKYDNEVTPYAGVVYNLDENHSVYASYTDIFKAQDYKDKGGNYLDPKEGKSYEAGIKGEYFDGALNASLAVFRIEQDNVAQSAGTNSSGETYYTLEEGVTSKGVEFDLSGAINENWNMSFGISHYEAKNSDDEKVSTTVPRTQFLLSSTYKTGSLTFGGSVKWQSKLYDDVTNPIGDSDRLQQDSFYLVNAMARYNFTKNLSAQLNINNLFDKEYYSNIVYDAQYVYGEPRNTTLTLKYTF